MSIEIDFINLKEETSGFLNVEYLVFSGGEVHVNLPIPEGTTSAVIKAYVKSSDDIMAMFMLTAICKEAFLPVKLILPYLPYARQDRTCAPGDAFSLAYFVMDGNFIFIL